jgi:hypothetical protein
VAANVFLKHRETAILPIGYWIARVGRSGTCTRMSQTLCDTVRAEPAKILQNKDPQARWYTMHPLVLLTLRKRNLLGMTNYVRRCPAFPNYMSVPFAQICQSLPEGKEA